MASIICLINQKRNLHTLGLRFITISKTLNLKDGIKLGYQEWGVGHTNRALCLHGWLDNSNSFEYLGPTLAESGFHVVAVDHVGHGLSSHISRDSMNNFFQYVTHVKYILEALNWDKIYLVGHSMGAIISTIFCGTFPEKVLSWFLLTVSLQLLGMPQNSPRI